MRGGLVLALALAAVLAGCIGALDEEAGPEAESASTDAEILATPDYSRPAGEDSDNLTSKLPRPQASPTEAGNLSIDHAEYDFGYTVVQESDPGPAYTAKLNGTVVYPAEGEGPFPLVAVLHGQHGWCYYSLPTTEAERGAASETCPEQTPATDPIPNFAGYGYVAETLASHGFVVVNVNGNSVNEKNNLVNVYTGQPTPVGEGNVGDYGTQSRAQLVLRTLDGFADVAAGEDPHPAGENADLVDALGGRLAMDEIGLVGHSRGGDGVTYAVEYNDQRPLGEPHDLEAVFAIAPTDFTDTRADDVPYAVLLPYCDGDVYNLWGADLYDRTRRTSDAPVYQWVAMGANHNFYNTLWTEHFDDADWAEDGYCGFPREEGGGRLSPDAQQRHGEALVAGFLRAHLGEADELEPWLRGRTLTPAGACPDERAPCPGLVHASYHPAPEDRLVVESLGDGEALDTNDLGGEVTVEGNLTAHVCEVPDCPSQPNRHEIPQLALKWDGEGAYTLSIPDEHRDASEHGWISLRLGVNHDADANDGLARQDLSLQVGDEDGRTASVSLANYTKALFVPPGATDDTRLQAEVTLSAASVPLEAFEGVDESRLESVSIVADRTPSGSVQVADVMFQR